MQVVYYRQEMPEKMTKSAFLAGPSLRSGQEGTSWRLDAIQILEDKGFDGVIFCPENEDGVFDEDHNYEETVNWEKKYLDLCDVIICWCPMDMEKLPGLTTRVEFGRYETSGRLVCGFPEDAERVSYLKHYAEQYNVPVASTLTETLENAMELLVEGVERTGGERYVPLFIWNTPSFQSWYQTQIKAGNRLEEARLLYNFRPQFKSFVFLWVLKVKVWIKDEDRVKDNEFVLSRTDISSVCLYHMPNDRASTFDTEVVLFREFRSPASTEDGFIHELPSGSSVEETNPEETAAHELHEETNFYIDPSRLISHGSRQLAGTFSAHKAHLFSAEISKEEIEWFKSQKDIAYGNEKDSERTFIEVHTIHNIIKNNLVDWTTVGMILSVIVNPSF